MRFIRKHMKNNNVAFISLLLNLFFIFKYAIQSSSCVSQDDRKNQDNLPVSPLCQKFDQSQRLKNDDLSIKLSFHDHFVDEVREWDVCASVKRSNEMTINKSLVANVPVYKPMNYCAFTVLFEQRFQYQFFPENNLLRIPKQLTCALLPPKNYQWPPKHIKLPATANETAVYWANLGMNSSQDLLLFNPKYPKNIAHFNTPNYDIEQEELVDTAAKYIPFGEKIRTMLDIGAGAGSISFIVNKRYDVTVLSTALPDFPYCEYITERGGLCILLDSRKILPFAKFSFDVIHHNWVFHSLTPNEWRDVLLEHNRILRPGGYLWFADGLSLAQLKTINYLLSEQLGYKILFEKKIPQKSKHIKFGSNPFEVSWHVVLVKPNRLKKQLHQCH